MDNELTPLQKLMLYFHERDLYRVRKLESAFKEMDEKLEKYRQQVKES